MIKIHARNRQTAAVAAGDYVFLGLHRGYGDTFSEQMRGAFSQIAHTLAQYGASLEQVVKLNLYLKRIEDVSEMEELFFDQFEADPYPARMTTTSAFRDEDCLVMIDGVVYHPISRHPSQSLHKKKASDFSLSF